MYILFSPRGGNSDFKNRSCKLPIIKTKMLEIPVAVWHQNKTQRTPVLCLMVPRRSIYSEMTRKESTPKKSEFHIFSRKRFDYMIKKVTNWPERHMCSS